MTAAATAPKASKIGIQLYMLGDAVGAHLEETLGAVRAIGFDAVELPQTYGRSAKALAAAIADAGLTCPSLHVSVAPFFPGALSFADGAAAVADFAATLGAKHVVVPLFPFPARLARALDRWKRLAEPYRTAACEALKRVSAKSDLSNDVREVIDRALAD